MSHAQIIRVDTRCRSELAAAQEHLSEGERLSSVTAPAEGRLPLALQPERLALVGQALERLGTRAHKHRTGLAVARTTHDDGARAARIAADRGLRARNV